MYQLWFVLLNVSDVGLANLLLTFEFCQPSLARLGQAWPGSQLSYLVISLLWDFLSWMDSLWSSQVCIVRQGENPTSRYLIILLPSRPEVTDLAGQQPKQINKVMSVFPFFSQKANFMWVEPMKKDWMDPAWVGSPAGSVIIKTATGIILHDNSLFFSSNSSIHSLFPLRCCFEAGQTQTTVIVGASVPNIVFYHDVIRWTSPLLSSPLLSIKHKPTSDVIPLVSPLPGQAINNSAIVRPL